MSGFVHLTICLENLCCLCLAIVCTFKLLYNILFYDHTKNDLSICVDGHFWLFPVGIIMNSADKDILVHAFTCIYKMHF